ncbi:lactococcin 972 family bacteriocin [Nocardiopsis sp. EMB25]|uniref:lactococcin 972 family bacteriocin n=1 Tax=Nocardiopsis TaxID=2013 RepID=UPI000A06E59C|nr:MULTISPECIES: lactococcin 972 family bacteriocin [Nocardiopsis]MCY9787583.1 lactococcin 972 family bacteriocin [Nocardiopsis sp. EMB25]
MNAFKRISIAALIASGITVGTAGVAAAVVEYVGGGTWSHGSQGVAGAGVTWSNYHHGSVCHGSTAVGAYTVRDSAPAGEWSRAAAPKALGNNQTYWRTSC